MPTITSGWGVGFMYIASSQQGDFRLSSLRQVRASVEGLATATDLRADLLYTVPPTLRKEEKATQTKGLMKDDMKTESIITMGERHQ
ncbi:hypothetical protein PoB_005488000 [Plakobranchus ocellatus]|uniref:Uncharacterized protein n=1 Tax=Plakobranchus ocellatus TaxID=259542 RepID=A0AAV4C6N1_9GAST|nr:hypothetical protein PoB_005488000 [Plakobranchus ocellatus]